MLFIRQPQSNTTPDQLGTLAVTGNTNTGHGSTSATANATGLAPSGSNSASQSKSCRWSSFQPASLGQVTSLRLKFTWSASGLVTTNPASDGSASASASFVVEYSVDGGSAWIPAVSQSGNFSGGADVDIPLPAGQDISQVQVRDRMNTSADATGGTVDNSTASAGVTATVSAIQLEATTVDGALIVMM